MSKEMLQRAAETIASGLRNKTLTTCSRWACKRRIMGAPFPGLYSYKYHAWCKEIHDADCTYITAKKSAQAGFTEVAINRTLYTIDVLRRSVLYVLPTKTPDAADFSTARFGQALELSDYLAELFTDTNKIELKQARGVSLYIRGSNSKSGLKSIPVSELILDEFDEMNEASVVLALERLSGQLHKHVFSLSTPTVPGFGIDKLYQRSTQEHFMFACPLCSRTIEFRWPDSIEIIGETPQDPRCQESFLKCYECKGRLDHDKEAKADYLGRGVWVPTVTSGSNDHRGFNINQMYSATVSPGELAVAYLSGITSEAAFQEFQNSKLGNAYLAADAQILDSQIDAAMQKGGHSLRDPRPTNARRMITMGIDLGKWSYITVVEWLYGELGYDLNATAMAKVLWAGKVGENDFEQFDRLMREWQVRHCVMDPDPNINDARRFARRYPGYVTLCRYRSGAVGKEIQISDEDSGAPMAIVDRTNWLDAALGRFHSGRIALPSDAGIEFREQLKAPARRYVKDKNGNPYAEYVDIGPDHYAHALTYAEIALPLAAAVTTNRSITAFL
jgi:hypothetical protein